MCVQGPSSEADLAGGGGRSAVPLWRAAGGHQGCERLVRAF
jgi:hypothetical protein